MRRAWKPTHSPVAGEALAHDRRITSVSSAAVLSAATRAGAKELNVSHYIIRVEGRLSAGTVSAFPALHSVHQTQTVVHGRFDHETTLGGVIGRLTSLGIDVVEVHRVPEHRVTQTRRLDLSGP